MGCSQSSEDFSLADQNQQILARKAWTQDKVFVPFWSDPTTVYAVTICRREEIPTLPISKGDRIPGDPQSGYGPFSLQNLHVETSDEAPHIRYYRHGPADSMPPAVVPHDFIEVQEEEEEEAASGSSYAESDN